MNINTEDKERLRLEEEEYYRQYDIWKKKKEQEYIDELHNKNKKSEVEMSSYLISAIILIAIITLLKACTGGY